MMSEIVLVMESGKYCMSNRWHRVGNILEGSMIGIGYSLSNSFCGGNLGRQQQRTPGIFSC